MWGHDKIKEWVSKNFTYKADHDFNEKRYWELWHKVNALYHHLGLEYRDVPSHSEVIKKDKR